VGKIEGEIGANRGFDGTALWEFLRLERCRLLGKNSQKILGGEQRICRILAEIGLNPNKCSLIAG